MICVECVALWINHPAMQFGARTFDASANYCQLGG